MITFAASKTHRLYAIGMAVFATIFFSACSASKHSNARLDRTISKLEKRSRKQGRTIEVDDVYYTRKDARTDDANANQQIETLRGNSSATAEASGSESYKDNKVRQVLAAARSYLGTPHRLGGLSRRGIDCSGLMIQSFSTVDVQLPRSSSEQARIGKKISLKQVKEGDLLFFSISRSKVGHVGVVSKVAENEIRFIHTSTSKGVREDNLFSEYWQRNFVQARRVL